MESQQKEAWAKAGVLSFLTLVCVALTLVVNWYSHTDTVYTHLYYVPIIVAAIWYHRKALLLAAFFSLLHIAVNLGQINTGTGSSVFLRASLFLFVAALVALIAEQKDSLTARLKRSNAELANIIEFYPDATLIIDNDGTVVAWNRAIETMTGVKAADMIGKGDMEYAIPFYGRRVPGLIDLVGQPPEEIRSKYSDVAVSGGRLEAVTTQAKIAGNAAPVLHATASKLCDADGRVTGAIESIRDITFQKKLETELGQKLNELAYQHDELEQQGEELTRQNEELLRVFSLLKASEEKHRIITESVDDAICVIDLQEKFTFFNRRAEEITGYRGEELIGRSLLELVDREIRPRMAEGIGQIVRGRVVTAYELVITRKDGRQVPVEMNVSIIRDAAGNPAGLIAAFRDITRRKEAEGVLKRYQMLSQYAHDIILFVRSDGRIIEANDAALLTYGYRRDELLAMGISDLRATGSPGLVAKQMAEADKGGVIFETTHRGKDGRLIPVEVSSRGVTLGGERVLLSIIRDITERKRAEAELRKLSQAVEESPATVVITDVKGAIEYVNPKFTQITGYTLAEALGRNPRLLKSGDKSPAEYRQLWETILAGKEWRGEFHNRKKNGELYWESAVISPLKDASGTITNFIAVKEDITDRKQAEAALRESEMRFRNIFEDSAVGIYLIDKGGQILDGNEAIQQMLGYSHGELLKLTVRQITDPDDFEVDNRRFQDMMGGAGDSYQIEMRYVRKDGSTMVGRLFKSVIRDIAGVPLYCVSMVEDFTDRKASEEALRCKNKELGIISNIASLINRSDSIEVTLEGTLCGSLELLEMDAGAIYLADPADKTKLVLRAFVPRTDAGYNAEPRKFVRADPSLNTEKVLSMANGGTPLFREIFAGQPAAVIVPILLKGSAIGLMAFSSGVTPAQSEELPDLLSISSQLGIAIDNHTLLRTLRATSNYMAEIINESPDAMLTVDARGTIISSNKRVARLLQYDMAELTGMNLTQLLPPDAADPALAGDQSYVRDFLRKDGTMITLNISTAHFETGDMTGGFIIALKDLSEIAGLKIVPLTEQAIGGIRKHHFEKGYLYLLDKTKGSDSMDIFADQVKHNIQGLCITRQNPKKIREQYGLEKTPIVWLNGSDLPTGEQCIKPDNLTGLGATIYKFLAEANEGIVLLDGAEYLVARNSFESVLKFLHLLNDRVMVSSSCLLLCLDPLSIETRQFHLVKTELRDFEEH